MSGVPSAEKDAGRIRRSDWLIYATILIGTFFTVLLFSGDINAAMCAACGSVLAATQASLMTTRAYRTRPLPPAVGDDA